MLELTGKCCGGIAAIEFMESLADVFDEDVKTEEFCEEYEAALNRFRYEVTKGIGRSIKRNKAIKSKYHDTFSCGKCGAGISEAWEYCPKCGTKIIH